jgi:hypothetical protein
MPVLRGHDNFNVHPLEGFARTDKAAGYRHDLAYVARDGEGDEVCAAGAAVGRIEGDPSRARDVDFRPGVSRAWAGRPNSILIGVVEVAGNDPRAEAEATCGFGEQYCKIPARAPAAGERLSAFNFAALIADPSRSRGLRRRRI